MFLLLSIQGEIDFSGQTCTFSGQIHIVFRGFIRLRKSLRIRNLKFERIFNGTLKFSKYRPHTLSVIVNVLFGWHDF